MYPNSFGALEFKIKDSWHVPESQLHTHAYLEVFMQFSYGG